MRAVVCGANGAMGKLICEILGSEVAGKVSIDGENGVAKTFAELGAVDADVVIDFSHHTAVASVLAYAKEIGCQFLTLNVWCGNDGAMRYYENAGLTKRNIMMEKKLC